VLILSLEHESSRSNCCGEKERLLESSVRLNRGMDRNAGFGAVSRLSFPLSHSVLVSRLCGDLHWS